MVASTQAFILRQPMHFVRDFLDVCRSAFPLLPPLPPIPPKGPQPFNIFHQNYNFPRGGPFNRRGPFDPLGVFQPPPFFGRPPFGAGPFGGLYPPPQPIFRHPRDHGIFPNQFYYIIPRPMMFPPHYNMRPPWGPHPIPVHAPIHFG